MDRRPGGTQTGRARPEDAGAVFVAIIRTARPRQWMKNLLVLAAPGAAGALSEPDVLVRALVAAVVFTLASAGNYLVNDVLDRGEDASHAHKRHRPVASGALRTGVATGAGVTLIVLALAVALALSTAWLAVTVAIYLAASSIYSLGAKHLPLVEMMIVASGFVLRAIAGAAATSVPVSSWFLIVTSFGAMYVVATKRYAEHRDATAPQSATRPVLAGYTPDVLREIRFSTASVTIVAYLLWAFESAEAGGSPWFELSTMPFVLAIFRYALAVHEGRGEAPEEIVLRDRQFQVYGLVWIIVYGIGLSVA